MSSFSSHISSSTFSFTLNSLHSDLCPGLKTITRDVWDIPTQPMQNSRSCLQIPDSTAVGDSLPKSPASPPLRSSLRRLLYLSEMIDRHHPQVYTILAQHPQHDLPASFVGSSGRVRSRTQYTDMDHLQSTPSPIQIKPPFSPKISRDMDNGILSIIIPDFLEPRYRRPPSQRRG